MALKKMVVQFGMGTSIRSRNYTQAGARAIRDALWHHSLNVADAFGFPRTAMVIDAVVAVQRPDLVDEAELIKVFPYGQVSVRVVEGGLDVPKPSGDSISVIANAAITVSFDMEAVHG